MNTPSITLRPLVACLLPLFLAACGGGAGQSPNVQKTEADTISKAVSYTHLRAHET